MGGWCGLEKDRAAVHHEGLARDQPARVGGEIEHGADQIVGREVLLQALAGGDGLEKLVLLGAEELVGPSVSTALGAIALTLTQSRPSSRASARVMPMTAAFDVA